MKRMMLVVGMASLFAPLSIVLADDDCGVFVRDAFNLSIQSKGASSSSSFRRFECSSEFKTHDQAIASGLSLGTTLYGVPLKVGGNFDTNQVQQWKSSKCSNDERNANNAETSYTFIRSYSPQAAELVKVCLERGKAKAIRCGFAGEGNNRLFTVEWQRTSGDNTPPVVDGFYVVNGQCQGPLQQGFALTEGIVAPICAFNSDENMVVSLQTSRGSCFDTAQKKFEETVLTGKQVLTGDTVYQADVVTFRGDLNIVTNGYDLTINAKRAIKIEGSPTIISYEGNGPDLALGAGGKAGGLVVLQSPLISGTQLRITNFGQNGAKGMTGDPGPAGHAANAGHRVNRIYGSECRGGSDASPGGKGNVGKPGGMGGVGGKTIIAVREGLYDGVIPRIVVTSQQADSNGVVRVCDGSCGGLGGAGGDGGPGGAAGAGAPVGTCGGRRGAPAGPVGDSGPRGQSGADGPIQML